MRIEIMVGSDDPQIYPLDQPKIIIGSSDTSDIILNDSGISRKHLIIGFEDDRYFVIDQGSTNGTYINEERLIPGRRTDFTSASPVRLGDNVLVSLLSDEDAMDDGYEAVPKAPAAARVPAPTVPQAPSPVEPAPVETPTATASGETTKMISLKDLQNAKTETLVKRRAQVVAKKKASSGRKQKAKPKSEFSKNLLRLTVIALLAGAIVYNKFMHSEDAPVTMEAPAVSEVVTSPPKVKLQERPAVNGSKAYDPGLVSREQLEALRSDIKCTTELEKYFCQTIPGADGGFWGVVQLGTMLNVIVDASDLIEEAKKKLPYAASGKGQGESYEEALDHIVGALFVLRSLPPTMDLGRLEGHDLTVGFFQKTPTGFELNSVMAISLTSLKRLKQVVTLRHLEGSNRDPASFNFLKGYMQVY